MTVCLSDCMVVCICVCECPCVSVYVSVSVAVAVSAAVCECMLCLVLHISGHEQDSHSRFVRVGVVTHAGCYRWVSGHS